MFPLAQRRTPQLCGVVEWTTAGGLNARCAECEDRGERKRCARIRCAREHRVYVTFTGRRRVSMRSKSRRRFTLTRMRSFGRDSTRRISCRCARASMRSGEPTAERVPFARRLAWDRSDLLCWSVVQQAQPFTIRAGRSEGVRLSRHRHCATSGGHCRAGRGARQTVECHESTPAVQSSPCVRRNRRERREREQ